MLHCDVESKFVNSCCGGGGGGGDGGVGLGTPSFMGSFKGVDISLISSSDSNCGVPNRDAKSKCVNSGC